MRKFVLPVVLLMFFFMSCASMGISLDTKEKKYLAARTELNLLLTQYIQIQDKVSDTDHAKAKQAFKAADMALDTWNAMLSTDYDYSKDVRTWLAAKNVIIQILQEVTK